MYRLAQYLFNYDNNGNNYEDNIANITQTSADDDWVLVDVESEDGMNGTKDETTTCPVPNNALSCVSLNVELAPPLDVPNTASIAQSIATLEESWFVTPPPCFNSQVSHLITIESSPFENLLIEHPSMSVFGPSLPRIHSSHSECSSVSSSTGTQSSDSERNQTQLKQSRRERRRAQHNTQNVQNRNFQSTLFAANAAFFNELHYLASMQSAEMIQNQKLMTKSYLDRQNKVAFQRNKPQNRKTKMAIRPNGSNFNRRMC